MLDELRALDWLPRSVRSAAREIDRGLRLAESMLGRAPTEGEVAEVMGLSLADYQKMLAEAHGGQLVHVDEWTEEDDSPYLDRQGITSGKNPLEVLMSEGFKTSLISAIEGLPDREKLLLSLYYEQGLNLKEVGAVLDVSESRVCQLHSQAMSRLRTRMKTGAWAADDTQS
jgi:RNA polymerase sigma factor FliA